jgi:phosphatidylserine/phosphatidylglycerophosphate/cardiolipin synthase-like enzyme
LSFAISLLVLLPAQAVEIHVGFSPDGGAEKLVVHTINGAQSELLVAAYTFTSKPIASALIEAQRRGINVQVVLDQSQLGGQYSAARFLANAGIAVRIDRRHQIMHNKYMIVDGKNIQTGSYNYTTSAAQKNAENAVFLGDLPELAKRYREDWQKHWDHSAPYTPQP